MTVGLRSHVSINSKMSHDSQLPAAFYKYTTSSTAKLILDTGRIRWSAPSRFNDPFEFAFPMCLPFELSDARNAYAEAFETIVYQQDDPAFSDDSPFTPMLKKLRVAARGTSRERFREELQVPLDQTMSEMQRILDEEAQRWKQDASRFRLLCVSDRNDSILMWSHYCEFHKGVVLQLRCVPSLDSPLCAARPVRYADEIPVFATQQEWIETGLGLREIDGSDAFYRQAYTKHVDWSYEKEWRVLTKDHATDMGDYEDTPFHAEEIGAIYFGCRISASERSEFLDRLTGKWEHVAAFQAHQLPKRFAVEFEQVKS